MKLLNSIKKLFQNKRTELIQKELVEIKKILNDIHILSSNIYLGTKDVLTLEEALIYSGLGDELKKAVEKKTIAYSVNNGITYIEREKLKNWILKRPNLK